MNPVEELLFEVLDRPDAAWATAVDELCAQHPHHAAELRRRFAILARSGVATSTPMPLLDGSLPERFGPYRLTQRLGGGGMGVVYRARHEGLGRDVAVKLVRPELLYFEGSRTRFAREIEAVARLQHPGCVQVHQVGEEHGIPYFAMELVAGISFDQLLGGLRAIARDSATLAKLSASDVMRLLRESTATEPPRDTLDLFVGAWPRTAVRLCLAAAEALAHAHTRGVVHRDVKPSNLMLTPTGRVVVIDFGLALAEGSSRVTRSGTLLGSLAYMAPEQVRGEHAAIDARTDVYALGVCLYELLSLVSPFDSPNAEQARARIAAGQVAALRAHNPSVDSDLATVCARAMEVAPQHRYQTMHAFAADLAALLEHRAIAARPASLARQAIRWAHRRPAMATALALGLIALLLGPLVVSLAVAEQRDRAVLAERLARGGEYAANVHAASLALATGNSVMARQRLDACPPDLRGFEWRYLDRATDASVATVDTGLTRPTAVAMTPDARVWASGHAEGEVAVFDGNTGQRRQTWRASDRAIAALQLSSDGTTLFCVDQQQHLRAFDCATGGLLRDRAPVSALDRVVLGASARSIVCALGPGRFATFDPQTLAVRREFDLEHTEVWPGAAFIADERQIVAPLAGGGIGVWSVATGKLAASQPGVPFGATLMAAPGCSRIAGFDEEKRLAWWDQASGASRLVDVGVFVVKCGALTPDGERLLAGCSSGELLVFHLNGGRLERRLLGHRSVTAVAASETGLVLTAGEDGRLRLYGVCSEPNALDLSGAGWGSSLAAKGQHLWTGGRDAVVRAIDVTSGARRWQKVLPHWINALALSDAERCLLATYHGVLLLLDPDTGEELGSIELPSIGPVTKMVTDAEGKRVACVGTTGNVAIVDLAARRAGRVIIVNERPANVRYGALTWDVVRDRVMVFNDRPGIAVIDAATERVVAQWPSEGLITTLLAEGDTLWTSELGATPQTCWLRRRNTASGAVELERATPVASLAVARLERRLVVGRVDGHISFHDAQTLELLLELREEGTSMWNLVGSRDGDWLALQRYPRDPRVLLGRHHADEANTTRARAQRAFAADLVTRELRASGSAWLAGQRLAARTDLDQALRQAAQAALPPAGVWGPGMTALGLALSNDRDGASREHLIDLRTALRALLAETSADHRTMALTATGLVELRLGSPADALAAVAQVGPGDDREWPLTHAARLFVKAAASYAVGDREAATEAHAALRGFAGRRGQGDWSIATLLHELDVQWSRR